MKQPVVYIMASKPNGTLYIGVTSDLQKRIHEHRESLLDGFTNKYGIYRLVYYEIHVEMATAIVREKQMKKWNRNWKIRLIAKMNPKWEDLYPTLF